MALAVLGASADLGTLVWAPLGAPANAVIAALKAVFKALPARVSNAIWRILGGGWNSFTRIGRFFKHYLDEFGSAADWLNPLKYREAIENVIRKITGMTDSPVVRFGGATDDVAGEAVGVAMDIMGGGTRALSDPAGEGIAGMVRHLDGGEAEVRDVMNRIVADDARESVSEAVSKTYRNEMVDPPGGPNHDPFGRQRMNDAADAVKATLQVNDVRQTIRTMIAQDSFVSTVIRSEEEFEMLLRMRGRNMTADQVHAINVIRAAMGMPQEGQRLARVIHLNFPGGFGAQQLVNTGNPSLAGFFTRAQDLPVAQGVQPLIDRFRVDGSPLQFGSTSPYAIMETRVNSDIAGKSRVPRDVDSATGDPDIEDILDPFEYPGTGKGIPAYKDGYPAPEWKIQGNDTALMDAGLDGNNQAITIMRCRNANGTPLTLTRHPDGPMASDWKLVQTGPETYRWDPCVPGLPGLPGECD